MKVRFWGTRGSIATPGPGTVRFGGNTSCVEMTTDRGECFMFDCGTGARPMGNALMARVPRPTSVTILLSHTHWDHIQGFPFFAPLFVAGNEVTVCGPEGSGRSLRDALSGQMEFSYFPVEISQLPAKITFRELGEGTHQIGRVMVVAQYLNHPATTLAYRVQADDATMVYSCDHEPFSETSSHGDTFPSDIDSIVHEGDRRHALFMAGAGLVIHDSQYTPEEYPAKKNWGHSTYEYAVGLAAAGGVGQLALTHHDPMHDDHAVAQIETRSRALALKLGSAVRVCCAYEGLELPAQPHSIRDLVGPPASPSLDVDMVRGSRILIVDDAADIRDLVSYALAQDGHVVTEAASGREALASIETQPPDLVLLDLLMPLQGGLDVLKILRSAKATRGLPVVVLTGLDDEAHLKGAFDLGATDYLTKPFSIPQLAARVRACLIRTQAEPLDA